MSQTIQKIILLINLFHNRDFVTMHDANTLCDINERSFYRYVNALSEIDIPIIYDKTVKGYRLTEKIVKRRIDFNAYEISLLTLGLYVFSQQTNESYAQEIHNLIRKIITLANFPLEGSFENTQLSYTNLREKNAISYYLNYTLLEIASSNELTIDIFYKNNNNRVQAIIAKPKIIFQQDWYVEDKDSPKKVLISDIEHISIKT